MKKSLLITLIAIIPWICKGETIVNTSEFTPDSSWLADCVHEVGITYLCPIIQAGYRKGDKKYLFETANFPFVTARPDATTIFQAASISKVVFGYIVMKLVDQGLIDLDRPLYEYTNNTLDVRFLNAFPDDPEANAQNENWAKMITARMALVHTSGISANWMRSGSASDAKITLSYEPGTSYIYSGEGTYYLQRVVQHITGKSLNELANEKVFTPFGMIHSSFEWRDEYHTTHAWGHYENNQPSATGNLRPERPANAAFSLRTNVTDFVRFLDALMIGEGLTPESYKVFTASGWYMGEGKHSTPGIRANYNEETSFGPMFYHSGSNTNFRAMFWLFPEAQTYAVYFTNSANGSGPMRRAMYDIFFPQFPDVAY